MSRDGVQSLVRRSAVAQVALAIMLVVVGVWIFVGYRGEVKRADTVREALLDLQALRGEILSAESGLRGYALTRRASFLDPYSVVFARIDTEIEELREWLPRAQLAPLAGIQEELRAWRAGYAERILQMLRVGREKAARALLSDTAAGKARIDRVRRLVATLSTSERLRLAGEEQRLERRGTLALIAVGGALVLLLAGAEVLRRRVRSEVVQPMRQLARAARAFGEGDLGQRLESTRGVREAAIASEAFNAMAARIEETVVELRELDELKTHFVASVSHELRTPLTSIRGFLDELLDPAGDPLTDGQGEMLAIVRRNARHLEGLVEELLLLARLEAGKLRLDSAAVDLTELLEEVCEELRPRVRAHDLVLEIEGNDGPVIGGDRLRLRQTFFNIVGNAIKFSPHGKRVAVGVGAQDGGAVVEVRDEGPGIPAAELPRIGERFFRASTAAGIKGTGLGLTISREIIELHGGRLEVHSTVGEGSTFLVHLPAGGR